MAAGGRARFCCRSRLPLAEIQLPAPRMHVDGAHRELNDGASRPRAAAAASPSGQGGAGTALGVVGKAPLGSPHTPEGASHLAVPQQARASRAKRPFKCAGQGPAEGAMDLINLCRFIYLRRNL